MDSQDFMTMINSRELLEEQLAASKKVDKNQTVTETRNEIKNTFDNAREQYAELEQEKELAAEAAAADDSEE